MFIITQITLIFNDEDDFIVETGVFGGGNTSI